MRNAARHNFILRHYLFYRRNQFFIYSHAATHPYSAGISL